jgi:hypothetical protein
LGFAYFLTGATARDLILENIFGRPPGRLTRDLDFGFALSDWKQFESLKAALIATISGQPSDPPCLPSVFPGHQSQRRSHPIRGHSRRLEDLLASAE